MASYSVSCKYNSATFTITGISSGNAARIVIRPTTSSSLIYSVDFEAYSSSLVVTIPDDLGYAGNINTSVASLTPETDYVCRVYIFEDLDAAIAQHTNYVDLGAGSFTTPKKSDLEQWSWTTTNGPQYLATAAQTQTAYAAITNKGLLTDFSYLVWNDLVYKTNQMVEDWDASWDTTYGTLSATLMTSSDKVMTAKRFNAVWYNIKQYATVSGVSSAVVSGQTTIKGSYFAALTTALNNAIGVG